MFLCYAILSDKKDALAWLERSLERKKEVTVDYVRQDAG
jgi:predicted nucleic acid-binding protein